jgi:2-polyprenyl-3-methyl-5-hydroxy-6-metoxy-1,4-benzoquinol methylase
MSFKCYLCGCEGASLVAGRDHIRFNCWGRNKHILKCLNCGLVQLFPQWTEDELDDLYLRYWAKQDFEGQKRKIKVSEYLTKLIKKDKVILEVGCGLGDNVRYLNSQGFTVWGIDKAQGAYGTMCDYRDYKPNVDTIYAIHLFEHLANPREFIQWMINRLNHNGDFILEMPNIDNVLLQLNSYRKFHWYPYHLFFWDAKTITILFWEFSIQVSFKVKQEYGLINHLRWLFKGKPGNWNPTIPIVDTIYKAVLKLFGFGDTLLVVGKKCSI